MLNKQIMNDLKLNKDEFSIQSISISFNLFLDLFWIVRIQNIYKFSHILFILHFFVQIVIIVRDIHVIWQDFIHHQQI